jgi:C1A family cysteine protease
MKTSVISLLCGCIATCRGYTFEAFVSEHSKSYDSVHEYFRRKDVFYENKKIIDEHNADPDNSFTLGINVYADLTWNEFQTTKIGRNSVEESPMDQSYCVPPDAQLPSSFDWEFGGAVTPVKNQGACGSCWSFSATGALEGLNFIANKDNSPLSEQQLVSCDKLDGGCNGGLMEQAFNYVARNGICSEADYPYTSGNGVNPKCDRSCQSIFTIAGYQSVPPRNETALQLSLYRQPISIAIEADSSVFQFYKDGVMNSAGCGVNLNHGVLLVGWGELDGTAYWRVKNSWGDAWGKDGYILLAKNISKDGQCGLALEPSYPVLDATCSA